MVKRCADLLIAQHKLRLLSAFSLLSLHPVKQLTCCLCSALTQLCPIVLQASLAAATNCACRCGKQRSQDDCQPGTSSSPCASVLCCFSCCMILDIFLAAVSRAGDGAAARLYLTQRARHQVCGKGVHDDWSGCGRRVFNIDAGAGCGRLQGLLCSRFCETGSIWAAVYQSGRLCLLVCSVSIITSAASILRGSVCKCVGLRDSVDELGGCRFCWTCVSLHRHVSSALKQIQIIESHLLIALPKQTIPFTLCLPASPTASIGQQSFLLAVTPCSEPWRQLHVTITCRSRLHPRCRRPTHPAASVHSRAAPLQWQHLCT